MLLLSLLKLKKYRRIKLPEPLKSNMRHKYHNMWPMLQHIGRLGDHIIVIVAGTFAFLVMSISYSAAAA